ncbi:MAG: transposon-transfer assisting family protein [Ruminococcus bromii]|nr:transposon-transfer assisting family protein [Ruminococcus bromii]
MMDFTHDEMNLMMLYSPGTLSGLREALTQMKEQLVEDEAELRTLADSVLNKLSAMDDETFERLNLYPDF